MEIGNAALQIFQRQYRVIQETEKATIGFSIFHHTEQYFRQKQSQHVFDRIASYLDKRETKMRLFYSLDITAVTVFDIPTKA